MYLANNHFYQAYFQSDFLGKLIFLSLFFTSILCWSVLIYKIWMTAKAKKNANAFREAVQKQKGNIFSLESGKNWGKDNNPFYEIYNVIKKQSVDILNKNRRFSKSGEVSYLFTSDINCIEGHMCASISSQTMVLEGNLFILSTIVGLAPLLGLLGTVWGILTSFSEMQNTSLSASNQMVIGGIALALTTTVMGLIIAIPSLIAYNYLKTTVRQFEIAMEGFSNELLSLVEMQYRKVDVHGPQI